MYRLAVLSVHGCPVARLGKRDTGGMNVYLLQTARELGRLGFQVDVYTRYHDPKDPQVVQLGENARVIHLQAGPYFQDKESLHKYNGEFLANLDRFQQRERISYDLIHSHYWLSGCAGIELDRKWDVAHVTTFHTLAKKKVEARIGESESKLRLAAEERVVKAVDAIVVSTEQEREDLCRLYQAHRPKVRVIPAGVDLGLFRPVDKASARRALGLSEKRIVLSVSRIDPLKGLDILIGAMARLEDRSDTRLLIVGGNPDRDREVMRLRSMAAEMGLEDVITFVGAVPQIELPNYYSAADVFVLPSYYESFGLVVLEAMACGTPVITSRIGGPMTFVTEGVSGYVIPWQYPEPFAEQLDVLLSNPMLRESMGSSALAKASTMGWDKVASNLSSFYTSLIGTGWSQAAGA